MIAQAMAHVLLLLHVSRHGLRQGLLHNMACASSICLICLIGEQRYLHFYAIKFKYIGSNSLQLRISRHVDGLDEVSE